MTIARMHGNQDVVRKLQEFKIPATTDTFANALYACAHGEKVTELSETAIALDRTKAKVPQLLALLQEIEANPKTFQADIEQRISMFTPSRANIHLKALSLLLEMEGDTLLRQPPYRFVLRYTDLAGYGVDKDHPQLGPNTVSLATRLATGCK